MCTLHLLFCISLHNYVVLQFTSCVSRVAQEDYGDQGSPSSPIYTLHNKLRGKRGYNVLTRLIVSPIYYFSAQLHLVKPLHSIVIGSNNLKGGAFLSEILTSKNKIPHKPTSHPRFRRLCTYEGCSEILRQLRYFPFLDTDISENWYKH